MHVRTYVHTHVLEHTQTCSSTQLYVCTSVQSNAGALTIFVHVRWVGSGRLGLRVRVYLSRTELPGVILTPLTLLHLRLVSGTHTEGVESGCEEAHRRDRNVYDGNEMHMYKNTVCTHARTHARTHTHTHTHTLTATSHSAPGTEQESCR